MDLKVRKVQPHSLIDGLWEVIFDSNGREHRLIVENEEEARKFLSVPEKKEEIVVEKEVLCKYKNWTKISNTEFKYTTINEASELAKAKSSVKRSIRAWPYCSNGGVVNLEGRYEGRKDGANTAALYWKCDKCS